MLFTNKKAKIISSLLVLITLLTSMVLTIKLGQNKLAKNIATDNFKNLTYPAAQTPTPETLENLKTLNILLLGYGGAGHDGGFLTDVIQVLHLNFDPPKLTLISIPRDLWVTLPSGQADKINEGFVAGADTSKTMAEVVTGLPIHYYVAIDFVNFQRLIGETLDGIEVNVPEVLDDPWYPIRGEELNTCGFSETELADIHANYSGFELERQFECRYEHLHFDTGKQTMEGGDALKYVRSRHGSSAGDFSRSQRQAVVLEGVRNKLLKLNALDDAANFFEKISNLISTDLDTNIINYLIPGIKTMASENLETLVLSTDNVFVNSKSSSGQFILLPKEGQDTWDGVHQTVNNKLKN